MSRHSNPAVTALVSFIIATSVFLVFFSYTPSKITSSETNQPTSKESSSLTLLGAGSRWAARGGVRALYVNWGDYITAHPNDPHTSQPRNATQRTSALIEILTRYNMTIESAADIPIDLSPYSVIIIDCYEACHPSNSATISDYLAKGGGAVLIGETPIYFVINDESEVQSQNDVYSIHDWLGAELITYDGGQALITENNTLGSKLLINEKVFTGPWGLPSANYLGGSATPKALWADGGIFAYTYTPGDGRLYYQAAYNNREQTASDSNQLSTIDFSTPMSVAVDSSDNVYVVDFDGVKKFTPSGELVSMITLIGEGLRVPDQIAIDSNGNIYIADWTTDCILKTAQGGDEKQVHIERLVTPNSTYVLAMPMGVAVDRVGNVFVADTGNDRIVEFDSQGKYVSKWGKSGSGGGYLSMPMCLAINGANVYIGGVGGVQKYTLTGNYVRMITSNPPTYTLGNGEVYSPSGVAVDNGGNVYVADSRNDRVQVFASDGTFIRKWGSTGQGSGQFWLPSGIAVDSQGNVYVADCGNDRIQKFTSDGALVAIWGTPKQQRGPLSGYSTRHDGWPYDLR